MLNADTHKKMVKPIKHIFSW